MTRDEAIEKIKKCMALASSPEAHEAAAALRQAQKLMSQFEISELDVTLADVSEQAQRARNVVLVVWESDLASMIASAFGCQRLSAINLSFKDGRLKRVRNFVFIGVNPAPEIAAYAFDVLSEKCAKGRRAHMSLQPKNCKQKTKVARGDKYAEGWIITVSDKLDSFAGRERDEELIERFIAQKYPELETVEAKDRTKGRNLSDNDWHAGHRDGKKVDLHHGLNAAASRPALPR